MVAIQSVQYISERGQEYVSLQTNCPRLLMLPSSDNSSKGKNIIKADNFSLQLLYLIKYVGILIG